MDIRGLPYDRQPVLAAPINAIEEERVRLHLQRARDNGRAADTDDPWEYLLETGGMVEHAGERYPTLAGILAFSSQPIRWVPNCGVRIGHFSGSTPTTQTALALEHIRAPLFEAIERAVTFVAQRTRSRLINDGARLTPSYDYPLTVIRELTVNALAHRDWSLQGSQVSIHLYADSAEWSSPGELPEGVTVDNILQKQSNRNQTIATYLFHEAYIESFGLGWDTIYEELRKARRPPPEMRNDGNFVVRISAAGGPTQTSMSRGELTPAVRRERIVQLLRQNGPLGISELEAYFQGTGAARRTLIRDLETLRLAGTIQMIGRTNRLRYTVSERSQ